MRMAPRPTVHADVAHRARERIVVREQGAAIAIATKRVGREKTGAADRGQIAALAPAVGRAKTLCAVFDHGQPVAGGDAVDGIHVGWLAVQRDRDDRARGRRDRSFDQLRIERTGDALDVDEHGPGADQHDRVGRRTGGKRRGDDLVTWPDAKRHQGDRQCRRARGRRDAMARARVVGQALLEFGDFRPHDGLAVVENGLDAAVDQAARRLVLRSRVDGLHALSLASSLHDVGRAVREHTARIHDQAGILAHEFIVEGAVAGGQQHDVIGRE